MDTSDASNSEVVEGHANKLNGSGGVASGLEAALADGPQYTAPMRYEDLERAFGIGEEDIPVAEALIDLACRKPRPTEFFRASTDPAMMRSAYVFIDKGEIGAEPYLVMPEARPYIADHLRPVQLVLCVNRQGVHFLWPIPLPDIGVNGGRHNRWGSSALEAMQLARGAWVKMVPGQGAYRAFQAENTALAEPQWPADKTFFDLVSVAFKDRLITSPEHEIVKRLRGQV
jgi:hypothetical protein